MPDYLKIYRVEPAPESSPEFLTALQEAGISEDEDTHTHELFSERLKKLAAEFPAESVRVVYEGRSDWLDFAMMKLQRGRLTDEALTFSLTPDASTPSKARPAPEVKIALDVPADELIDRVAAAAEYEDEVEPDDEEEDDEESGALRLPLQFKTPAAAGEALSLIAAHQRTNALKLVILAEDALYEAALEKRKGASLSPLFPWVDDESDRALVRSIFRSPQPNTTFAAVAKGSTTTQRDPTRPLTTGSLRARIEAAALGTEAPGSFDELANAVRAPENAAPAFAAVREALYRALAKVSPDSATPLLIERLADEPEQVRATLYRELSNCDDPRAHRVLVQAFCAETDDIQSVLRQILWRQRGAIELLVREHLVRSWGDGTVLARRILHLLHTEYIQVDRAWVEGAPAELLTTLGPSLAQ